MKFVENFRSRWLIACAQEERVTWEEAKNWYDSKDLQDLSERISGKEGIVIETAYGIGKKDYFEKHDNNFVIFEELFSFV